MREPRTLRFARAEDVLLIAASFAFGDRVAGEKDDAGSQRGSAAPRDAGGCAEDDGAKITEAALPADVDVPGVK